MPTTTRFHTPPDTLDALSLLLAQDYDHFTVCASIQVRADWGSSTTTAYEGHAISKAPGGGLFLWFWRSTCDETTGVPFVQVYSVHSLSKDCEDSFRALLGHGSTVASAAPVWAVPLNSRWTESCIVRVIHNRYAE